MKFLKNKILYISVAIFFTAVSFTNAKHSTNNNPTNVVLNYLIDTETGYTQNNQEIKENIKVFVNGKSVSSIDNNGVLRLSLSPGDHEVLAYVSGKYAAKTPIHINSTELIELDVFLKSEGLASIITNSFRIIGSDKNIVKARASMSIESISSLGERFLISEFSHIRAVRIEPGSFRENIGGKEIGRSIFLTNEFEVIDGVLVASKPLSLYEKINSSSRIEYVFDIGAVDLKTGFPLDGLMNVIFTTIN